MNIMELGAIGEFAASVAVLATLIFLVIEMRRNNTEMKRSNVRQVTSEHVRALEPIATDEALAEMMQRGWSDLGRLDPVERYRFDIFAYAWLASIEQAFADFESDRFPEDSMIIFRNNVPGVVGSDGGRRWWRERQVWFSKSFRDNVDRLLANPNEESVGAGVNPLAPPT